MTSFYFQGIRKCFLEISIRLEVLLVALFISVSNRYQPKEDYLSAFRDWGKRLQKCVSVQGGGGGGGGVGGGEYF